jgi:hypothetical protein
MESPSTQAIRNRRSLGLHSTLFGAHQEYLQSPAGAKHTIEIEELVTISKFINGTLADDPDVQDKLPVYCDFNNREDVFEKMKDGIILVKIINMVKEDTIPMHKVKLNTPNRWKIIENLNLVIEGVHKLGLKAINIGAIDIAVGRLLVLQRIVLNGG